MPSDLLTLLAGKSKSDTIVAVFCVKKNKKKVDKLLYIIYIMGSKGRWLFTLLKIKIYITLIVAFILFFREV